MSAKVLYIHGFASSSESFKAIELEKFFDANGFTGAVLRPSLPVAPQRAIDMLIEIIEQQNVNLVIGSSLGGFYALYLNRFYPKKTVLINPSLHPSRTLSEYLGIVKRHNSDDFFYWTEEHIKQLAEMEEELDFQSLKQDNLYFYLSKDDEILDLSAIPQIFHRSTIKFYDDSKHVFMKFDKILPEILSLYLYDNQ